MYDLLIRGRIVLPDRVLEDGVIAAMEGHIALVGTGSGPWPSARRSLDVGPCYVLPGAVDAHVHARSDPAEGLTRCTQAAAAGGVTTIIDMPYDAPAGVPDLRTFQAKVRDVSREAVADVALFGTVRPSGGLDEIERIAAAGACAFKVSTYGTDPIRFPRIPDGELLRALSRIAATGLPVAVHCENQEIVDCAVAEARAAGRLEAASHARTRPPVAETEAVGRVLELAFESGAHVHIVHASVPRSLDLVHRARQEGVRATVETCIQYLVLDESAMDRLGPLAKINPPLRSAQHRSRLWEDLVARRIDFVTSDHAPWSRARKSDHRDIFANASGAPGVETLLPLLSHHGVAAGRISVLDLARLLSETPARTFGLFPRKGILAPGADADLVVLDPAARWVIRGEELHSGCRWTPYEGMEVTGRVVLTVVRGRVAYEEGRIVAEPGWGGFVRPIRPA